MDAWIQFGRGPLFAVAYSLMVLGLARILLLTAAGVAGAYGRSWDRIVNWREVAVQTVHWLLPIRRLWRKRPVYSTVSTLFHIGLILVPWFGGAHVLLWRRSVGFAWGGLPERVTLVLTVTTLLAGVALLLGRAIPATSRELSGAQEYFWPALLLVPFATGFACSHLSLSPLAYERLMLVHVYTADLVIALLPFTKLAHCVLAPISHVVTAVAWKFPVGGGDRVAETLGYADQPTWVPKSRLGLPPPTQAAIPSAPAAAKPGQLTEEVSVP